MKQSESIFLFSFPLSVPFFSFFPILLLPLSTNNNNHHTLLIAHKPKQKSLDVVNFLSLSPFIYSFTIKKEYELLSSSLGGCSIPSRNRKIFRFFSVVNCNSYCDYCWVLETPTTTSPLTLLSLFYFIDCKHRVWYK